METISLRSVNKETRTYIKEQAVKLHKAGKKLDGIVEALNISYDAASRIISAFKKHGAIPKEKTRGRKKGEKRKLSPKQEREIQRIIIDKRPDQVKLGFALWTRAAIQQLIRDKYGIEMPMRSISNYLDRWGLTCQRPSKRAYSQDDVARKDFMEREYPAIARRAKKEKAAIYWGDETGINNQEYYLRGFRRGASRPFLMCAPSGKRST